MASIQPNEVRNVFIERNSDPFGNVKTEKFPSGISIQKSYDLFNRPLEVTLPDSSKIRYTYDPLFCRIVFDYDPLGRKIFKTKYQLFQGDWQQTSKENYLFDGNCDFGTVDSRGRITQLRVMGITKEHTPIDVAIELAGKPYVPIQDKQGNVRRLVDAMTCKVVSAHDFYAFGEVLESKGELFNPWQYAAKLGIRSL